MNSAPRLLLALVLTSALGAGADPVPVLQTEGRVVLAPLNLGVRSVPELDPGMQPVWDELVRLFEEQTSAPASLSRDSATALWATSAREDAGGDDVYAAYSRFARRVAEQVEFDALVIPALVSRTATIEGHQAHWDGVWRLVDVPRVDETAGAEFNLRVEANGGRGTLRAASLHVAILGPDGALRFEGAGGVALLQRLELQGGSERSIRVTDDPSPFGDASSLRKGVRTAFEHPLPASRAH